MPDGWTRPFKSLDAAVATGAGGAFGGQQVGDITVQVLLAGGDSVSIEASNDGVNWVTLGSAITSSGITAVDAGYVYYRANLTAGSGPCTAIFAGS